NLISLAPSFLATQFIPLIKPLNPFIAAFAMDVPNERALLTTAFFFLSIHLPMPSIISFEAVTNFWNSSLAPVYNDFANPTALFLASSILLWIVVYILLNNIDKLMNKFLTRLTTI